jgi:hypothetical protein
LKGSKFEFDARRGLKCPLPQTNAEPLFTLACGVKLRDFGVADDILSADAIGFAAIGLRQGQHLVETLSADNPTVSKADSVTKGLVAMGANFVFRISGNDERFGLDRGVVGHAGTLRRPPHVVNKIFAKFSAVVDFSQITTPGRDNKWPISS